MGHQSKDHYPHTRKKVSESLPSGVKAYATETTPTLALVIKSDTDGCEQAVCELIAHTTVEGVPVEIIHKGVGDISKTDIMTAATGSRLVLGFNVKVLPRIAELCKEENVEVRLYSVIYRLQEDLTAIARSLLPREVAETVVGRATVIALFKGSRKGVILGCEVESGRLQRGDHFRIISAMGPLYAGTIDSMHREKETVNTASPGQRVGVRVDDFKNVRVGDLIECYKPVRGGVSGRWQPSGNILHL